MVIIRVLLACLDYIVYSLAKWIMYVIFDLSNLTTSSELLNSIYQRVYLILAIFMAFKLSFSFFKYLVSPESMRDDKQGIAALFKNVMIMLAALIAIPAILFGTSKNGNGEGGLLARAQKAFLPMVPRIILGIDSGDSGAKASDDSLEQASEEMALAALKAFFTPAVYGEDDQNIIKKCKNVSSKDDVPQIERISDIVSLVNETCKSGFSIKLGIFNIGAARYYYYSYTYIASLIVGIILDVSLLGLCIDVAKRVFKIIVLQVVAPIPIMSLIDPGAASEKGRFGKWLKMLTSTYLELFIKLGVLYAIVLLIQKIVEDGLFSNFPKFTDHPIRALFLTVALIIGLFQFAREAPKFISDALGVDASSGGGMMGKMAKGLGGAAAGFAGGALQGNAMAGAVSGARESYNAKPGETGNAFHKGSETAARIQTGDDKREVGFGASMMRRVGAGRGYSSRGFQEVKGKADTDEKRAQAAELSASQAQSDAGKADQMVAKYRNAADAAQRGADRASALNDSFNRSGSSFGSWLGTQSGDVQAELAAAGVTDAAGLRSYVASKAQAAKTAHGQHTAATINAQNKHAAASQAQAAASQARTTADKSAKARDKYKNEMGRYNISERNTGGIAGLGERAGYAARHGIHDAGRAVVNGAEQIRGVGAVVRTIDSAHQQHMLNQFEDGTRANNVVDTVDSGGNPVQISERDARIAARHELDEIGTAQGAIADFGQSLGFENSDGHIGANPEPPTGA